MSVGSTGQQGPPERTRKKLSMSESVPVAPSPVKSAVLVPGAAGQEPERQAKNDSMSESVPTAPSQLKSAVPQVGVLGTGMPATSSEVGWSAVPGLNRATAACPVTGATLTVKPMLNISPQRNAL